MHTVMLFLARYWRGAIALVLVAAVVGYIVTLQRQVVALTRVIEAQKVELAEARGAIVKLSEAVKNLKPGETATAEIPKPQYIPYPVDRPGPLRIEYIRVPGEPGRIETRTETITLPAKEVEKVIDKSPQSIIAEFTATRDIAKSEKFRLVAVQIAPGVYQPILDLGAPVTVDVRTATPLDRIPAPIPAPSRWTTAFLLGPDAFHPRGATVLTRAEVEYRISPRLFTRGEVSWHWNGAGASGLLLLGARF